MNSVNSMQFLSGGGEMGAMTRAKNWENTPVGPVSQWPQSLRTTLSIILSSKFPMFLWWGPELICFYNDAYRPSLGENGKHPNILGMPAEEAWPEIWTIIKPLIDQVLQGGSTWSEDQLIPIFRNGKIEDVYWTFGYSPVNDESGKPAGVLVTCTETTGKVVNLMNLNASKEELEFAIEAAELGTWDLNPATGKFTANERLKNWFGLKPESEIVLANAIAEIAEEDRDRVTKAIGDALLFETGGKYSIEYTIIHPQTQKRIIVHAKGKAWFDENQQPYRFNGTLRDITEQKLFLQQLEKQVEERTKELRDKNAALEKMNRELQSFAYISSHDLQEPLRKIQTFSSLMQESEKGNLTQQGQHYFERMQLAAYRMQMLIDDLLAYSRTAKNDSKFVRADLGKIIAEIRRDLQEEIDIHRAVIEAGDLCELRIIPFQFRQLLQNLISNSMKFSKPGIPPHIKIASENGLGKAFDNDSLKEGAMYCHLSISDNGIGFPPEFSSKIFELFQRLHSKDEYMGTGIGLAIVKKIVENHDGIITATGGLGDGARFDIYIPMV